ncbi:hypothetical protein ASPZODRAFT_27148 [Penicilliopsis zonata CBS 506.65]|uniref:Lipocalin-like domain-containing protein n=1 Tax=Penicilliopsis zonata CBS 506.65 TaxID=1073090 RepID=A0A1L9SD69_9EURO|nr:hypothetical protein ASPZODRAFT_27148 [Penicilliopsis zonata CBS 506.65]OJJ45146.1 hypothetical protein ASPZODRAFT_27148 [Penicilliopsis zonata CBS 506.65]
MRVYVGKLNSTSNTADKSSKTAVDEVISFAFDGGFREGSTAVLVGQWTKSYEGHPKANYNWSGTITKYDQSSGEIEIFTGEDTYYCFTGNVSGNTMKLDMFKQENRSEYGSAELQLKFTE